MCWPGRCSVWTELVVRGEEWAVLIGSQQGCNRLQVRRGFECSVETWVVVHVYRGGTGLGFGSMVRFD